MGRKRDPQLSGFSGRAFTLIELIVVIGIIGIVLGGLGWALRDRSAGPGLAAGQRVLAALFTEARGVAAVKETKAMLVVCADTSSPDRFLRSIQVVYLDPADTTQSNWLSVDDGELLPRGVYLVPPNFSSNAAVAALGSVVWPTNCVSGGAAVQITINGNAGVPVFEAPFRLTSRGTVDWQQNEGSHQLVLAHGVPDGHGKILFSDPADVRGIRVSNFGVATLIDNASSFE